jgi:Ribosomal protein L7/L12 C-terminal domain.
MTDEERISILKLIRQETGCGLKEAEIAFDKLLEALKNKPVILDKPSELVITWK